MKSLKHRPAMSIYALAASIVLVIALFGYIVKQNRDHDRELARNSLTRQEESNQFFSAVCDRFALRDEIILDILQNAYSRALASGERVAVDNLGRSIIAFRDAQGNCRKDIPKIRRPPEPQP